MKRRYILGGLLAAAVLATLLYVSGGHRTPAGQPALRSLTTQNFAEIQDQFNLAKNDARLLLLMSPT